jgi:hypothetical protein
MPTLEPATGLTIIGRPMRSRARGKSRGCKHGMSGAA